MYTRFLLLILSLWIMSCQKNDSIVIAPKKVLMIEEYIHDDDGVIFKITNDIDSLINNRTKLIQKIDSLSFKKFHFSFSTDSVNNRSTYTWMKKDEYVCWKYKYVYDGPVPKLNPNDDRYFLTVLIDNPAANDINTKYCTYDKLIYYNQSDIVTAAYQSVFPYPVNDTVYVSISAFLKQFFPKYIK